MCIMCGQGNSTESHTWCHQACLHGKMYMENMSIKHLFHFLVISVQQLVSSCLIFCETLPYSSQNLAVSLSPLITPQIITATFSIFKKFISIGRHIFFCLKCNLFVGCKIAFHYCFNIKLELFEKNILRETILVSQFAVQNVFYFKACSLACLLFLRILIPEKLALVCPLDLECTLPGKCSSQPVFVVASKGALKCGGAKLAPHPAARRLWAGADGHWLLLRPSLRIPCFTKCFPLQGCLWDQIILRLSE